MTFTEKLINNINNCYTNDPGFFWGFFIFLVISVCGIYLTLPFYRKHVSSEYFFKIFALVIFFSLAFLITIPIFCIEQVLNLIGFKIPLNYLWVYLPVPIFATISLKKTFNLNYKTPNHPILDNHLDTYQIKKAPKSKTEKVILFVVTFFAIVCVTFALDSIFSFLSSEVRDYLVIFVGSVVTIGIVISIILKIYNTIEFGKKYFTRKHLKD